MSISSSDVLTYLASRSMGFAAKFGDNPDIHMYNVRKHKLTSSACMYMYLRMCKCTIAVELDSLV